MHISGEIIAKFAGASKCAAPDETPIHLYFDNGTTPLLSSNNEVITLGDIRELVQPFLLWGEY